MATKPKSITPQQSNERRYLAVPSFADFVAQQNCFDTPSLALALARWLEKASTFIQETPADCASNVADIERRVQLASRALTTGAGLGATGADLRDVVEDEIRWYGQLLIVPPHPDRPYGPDEQLQRRESIERGAVRAVRGRIAAFAQDFPIVGDSLTDKLILDAVHASTNKGGRARKKLKLKDALDAIWKALRVVGADTSRIRRRRSANQRASSSVD